MEILDEEGNFSKNFFVFMKYNLLPQKEEIVLSETDEKLYAEFCNKVKNLKKFLETDGDAAKAMAASLFSMFGYSRHYCTMTGQPIIGKYFKLNGKIVSKEAYEAHKIVQEIEGFDEKTQQKHSKNEGVGDNRRVPKRR